MKPRQPTARMLAALVAGIAGLAITPCTAQDLFPTQPITVVTHASPGGGTDSTARAMMLGTRTALDVNMAVVPKTGGVTVTPSWRSRRPIYSPSLAARGP